MGIQRLEQARTHPARTAAIESIRCVETGDREGWLAMWDENGVIEDPVGPSPLDPEGKGHRGMEAITAFYDNIIAGAELRFHIRETFACGNECANVGTITTRTGGMVGRCELVMVYRINDDGKMLSLRAFWEFDDMVESMM